MIELIVESSKSRSGLHAERKIALIYSGGRLYEPSGATRPVKPRYARGSASAISVSLRPGEYAVQLRLVRGPRGKVKGYIKIIDSSGKEAYVAVIRKRKMRPSKGDVALHHVAELVVERVTLSKYLRKYKLGDTKSS